MENNDFEEKPLDSKKHPKQDFQVERMAFFSDAVFAIALTLLVLEFKIPHITGDTTFDDAFKQIWELKYLFIATLLSFFLITNYWRTHHNLFKYIHNYDNKLVTINMLLLLPIIFTPFTTALFAESIHNFYVQIFNNTLENDKVYFLGFKFFLFNHFFAMLMCYIFYWYALVKHKELSYVMPEKEKFKFLFNTWVAIIFMGSVFVTTFFNNLVILNSVIYAAVIIWLILKRKYKKKLSEKETIQK